MVDPERIGKRLDRLEPLLQMLERIRAGGEGAYLADSALRLQAERGLQLAEQICIDVGAQLIAELGLQAPDTNADVFVRLREGGLIDDALAERLVQAARQRNILVHDYLEIDDRIVYRSLTQLDDLRTFAAHAQRLADEPGSSEEGGPRRA